MNAMSGAGVDADAIMAMLRAETDAWLRRDFDALADCWVHSPQSRRLHSFASTGVRVDEGWDAIAAHIRKVMQRHPTPSAFEGRVRWENVNIVVDGNMGWVTYDQIGLEDITDMKRLLKVVHRVDGGWRIACLSVMQSIAEQSSCPLIQVDRDAHVVWVNGQARDRIREHAGLVVSGGRLLARQRARRSQLRETLRLAFDELDAQVPLNVSPRQDWAVQLGADDSAEPLFCWVLLEDGKVMVSFDHADMVERHVAGAEAVYRLSPAQARLARLIVDGHDLSSASEVLGVSINTVRTQLQRTFDKTGARSRSALVRRLLSAEPPNR
ncbi:LuxR family transcriptional regulator [Devosia sp. ZB163]|uniref:LuxR family transcriptional regulator n=1 Tax=Devosia sp. ZB163 TaxID=3025938 RepID=UPI00235E4C78|nr:LuxR family transcriptional regulator [Devosia sp. ZB163]MDC9825057.1 LuxR family transcriptional regulator [Devosia sp. ZB163]